MSFLKYDLLKIIAITLSESLSADTEEIPRHLNPFDWHVVLLVLPVSFLLVRALAEILERRSLPARWSYTRLGLIGWLSHGVVTATVHYFAWVPVLLVAGYSAPLLILPMVARWLYEHPPHVPEKQPKRLWLMDEVSRALEQSVKSPMITAFKERYPDHSAYMYRRSDPYSVGGVLLQSRVRLHTPKTAYLEVTLDCPFGSRPGSFLEGHEILQAYIFRQQEDGSRISFIPIQEWDEWLTGMRKMDWYKLIGKLDRLRPAWPRLGDLPFLLVEERLAYQRINLI